MKTNTHNKDNSVSFYGLACGYIDRIEKDFKAKELYMEHNTIHVKLIDRNNPKEFIWHTFEKNELTKARKFYKSLSIN